jgi:hypothetical protein
VANEVAGNAQWQTRGFIANCAVEKTVEQISLVKNRIREICTSGSVNDATEKLGGHAVAPRQSVQARLPRIQGA